MNTKENELFIPWKEAPATPTAENPFRSGAALNRRGHILGHAPESETDNEAEKRTVLDYNDLRKMVPFFEGKPRLVHFLMKWLKLDDVNYVHHRNLNTPGAPFVRGLLDDFRISVRIDNAQVLDHLPEGAFITVSNHPFRGSRRHHANRLVCITPPRLQSNGQHDSKRNPRDAPQLHCRRSVGIGKP